MPVRCGGCRYWAHRSAMRRSAMTRPRYSDFGLYRRLARHTRSSWPSIAALFVAGLVATPLALLTPLPLEIAVHSVLGAHPLPRFIDARVPTSVTSALSMLLIF